MGIDRFEDISELYVALDQKYIGNDEFQDVYDHAGRTRAAIRGFINYLITYEKKKGLQGSKVQRSKVKRLAKNS